MWNRAAQALIFVFWVFSVSSWVGAASSDPTALEVAQNYFKRRSQNLGWPGSLTANGASSAQSLSTSTETSSEPWHTAWGAHAFQRKWFVELQVFSQGEEPGILRSKKVGTFSYEWVRGNASTSVIRVTAVGKAVQYDPSTLAAELEFSRKPFRLLKKTYFVKDLHSNAATAVNAPVDGVRLPSVRWEALPLAPEDLSLAVCAQGSGAGQGPTCFNSAWETDDFFGRPVQVWWKSGEPWPRRLKSAQGEAILQSGGSHL